LTDLIRKKYGITIEKDIIENIHLSGFLLALEAKLNIKLKDCKAIDINQENPIDYDDILSINPKV